MLKVESLHCTTKNHKQIFCKENPGLTLEFFFKMAESIFRQDKGVVQRKKMPDMDGSYILDTAARRKVRGRRRRRRTQAIAKGYAFYSKSKRDSDIGASL